MREYRRRRWSPGKRGLGFEVAAEVAPVAVAQKGGGLASLHLCAKPADQGAQRGLLIAELLGDVLQATPFDEEGTQRFVLAVIGLNRFKKETAAARIIHEPALRKVDRLSPSGGDHKGRKCPAPRSHRQTKRLPGLCIRRDTAVVVSHRRRSVAQSPWVNNPLGKINRSTFQSQVIRFSGQKLRSLIPDCCRISLRRNRRTSPAPPMSSASGSGAELTRATGDARALEAPM